jgi:GNAT superfamily N-acetyltransferase
MTTKTLPPGYEFIDRTDIAPDKVMALQRLSIPNFSPKLFITQYLLNGAPYATGVIDNDETLVGFGSVIPWNNNRMMLADLVVHPDHRSRGIGKALVRRRVGFFDKSAEANSLVVNLWASNTLHSFYEEVGFRSIGKLLERQRQNP